ncbi:hypothetical protein [Shewanella surugensis]|uniref:Uncharacterized protein n=1 Tax=Shewanella surugensis TaxID=212020 RepID=A0ABT0LJ23_9GAMM|nr:hypothetical protein [Shewanella surugensis]MCL1127599.1 hypothetical protein [Shewanella surugensis]
MASKYDASNSTWHRYREAGPTIFDQSMMIVVDDWGVDNAPKKSCSLEVMPPSINGYALPLLC